MLKLNHISSGYHQTCVIHDINLSFEQGTIYTIVGKNGCGKSTLLKACAGILPLFSGKIFLDNQDLTQYSSIDRAKKLTYLSQFRTLPNITVGRLLEHGRFPHLGHPGRLSLADRQSIDRVIDLMNLRDLCDKPLPALSGGECQRVFLAMKLVQDTPILLLDEPTTYMDIEYQLFFLDLLTALKEEGRTIVLVLHDLSQVLHYSDRILVMDEGRVIQTGTPKEISESGVLSRVFHVKIDQHTYPFHAAE